MAKNHVKDGMNNSELMEIKPISPETVKETLIQLMPFQFALGIMNSKSEILLSSWEKRCLEYNINYTDQIKSRASG